MKNISPLPPGVFRLGAPAAHAPPARFPLGLGARGLHEVVEKAHGDMAALTGFALAAADASRPGAVMWVRQARLGLEHGEISERALARFCAPARKLLTVRAGLLAEALWASEEAVRSGAVALVIAELEDADFTAARRLALASERSGVPLIALMPHSRAGASPAAARWRVAPAPSAPNPFDARAPGRPRWRAALERAREAPQRAGEVFELEYDDETLSLHLAAPLAARPAAPRLACAQDGLGETLRRKAG